jgi:hypothetical protein
MTPFERVRLVHEKNFSGVLEEKQSFPHHRPCCNTTLRCMKDAPFAAEQILLTEYQHPLAFWERRGVGVL